MPPEKESKVDTFTPQPSLVAQIDAIEEAENRPRARQVTTFLQEAVRRWQADHKPPAKRRSA
jgi:hypothetical protein